MVYCLMPTIKRRKRRKIEQVHPSSRRRKCWKDPIYIESSVALVVLTKGAFALVDAEDAERLNQHPWHVDSGLYAHNDNLGGMHRFVMGLAKTDPRIVDHLNGLRYDNRKKNLSICNQQQNMASASLAKKRPGDLPVGVGCNGKRFSAQGPCGYLGTFDSPREAVIARIIAYEVYKREKRSVRWSACFSGNIEGPLHPAWLEYLGVTTHQMDQLASSILHQAASPS